MLRKTMIILLYLLIISAFILGIWYLTKINGWPLWVGGSIFAGIIGVILAFIFIRRYFIRSNERKFVKRVIAQEGESVFASSNENSLLIDELKKQWEKAIKTLYGSKLNNGKNPIYALPWILVIGESGSGKTSLIKNSRLSSAVTDVEASAQYAGTKNCDWWFFENAIILDTAGRYSIPIEERRDNAEWERFLSLLSKYRKEEPLNGLVVTISVERLLENDKDIIQADALSIRKRIDQLMVSIGAKFPVYLMVTKMDRLYGFSEFCESLPKDLQTQAMGYLNESLNQNWEEVFQEGIDFIKQKITSLGLLCIEHDSKNSKEILLFSKEFQRIVPALKDFSSIVFGDNPYQKIPMLRGVYFSSALSDAQSDSEFLSNYNLTKKQKEPKNKAYFIADFFKVILPNDRSVFTPIKEYLSWQKRNYKLAVGAWLLVFLSAVGIYSYSYIQNIILIKDVKNIEKYDKKFEKMDLPARIIALDKLRLNILKIEKLNNNELFALLKFDQTKEAEKSLKNLFHNRFNEFVYKDFAFKLNESINKINNNTPSKEVVSYIGFLIDSIELLREVKNNQKDIQVSKLLATWIKNILFQQDKNIDTSLAFLFVNNYIAFQKYNTDKTAIEEQIKIYKELIYKIVNKKGSNLHWLTDEGVSQTPRITIKSFFKDIDEEKVKDFPSISGSLTQNGRKNLEDDINVLVKELDNNKELKANLASFWQWYDERFFYRWKNFAIAFKKAQNYLRPEEKEQIIYAMASDQNPYFTFIHMMAKEFKAYKPLYKAPSWTKTVIEIDEIMSIAQDIRNAKNSLLSKVGSEKDEFLAKAQEQVNEDGYVKKIKSATLFNKYVDDLLKLSNVVDKKQSKLLIRDFFAESASQSSPVPSLNDCDNHYKQFIHSLTYHKNSDFIYELVAGPKNEIINYAINQMDEILNEEWRNKVLNLIPLSSNTNVLMSLFDKKKGLVWKYIDEELQPFIRLDKYGYSIKIVSGYKLHIRPKFLRYINSGIDLLSAYKPQYDISISTLPFDVNKDAKIEPDYVSLHLRCAKADYILKNENYPLTKVFQWVPSKCGDTVITFAFADFNVKKTYKGENGFLYFLKDFRDGTKWFRTEDFDAQIPQLKLYNIKDIKLTYNISGEGKILKLLDKTPYEVPRKVTGYR